MDVFIHSRFDAEFHRHPLVLIDVGARGGVKSNWARAERHLRSFGFEPDKGEFSRLVAQSKATQTATFFETALHSRRGPIRLNIARDRGLTSVFEPDREFVDAFPEAARFDVVDSQQVDADTLDNQLQSHDVSDVDFVKVDTQGSELFVLEGARHALDSTVFGVEAEVEFTPIYRGQPLFSDVDKYLARAWLFAVQPPSLLLETSGGPFARRTTGPDHLGRHAVSQAAGCLPTESRRARTGTSAKQDPPGDLDLPALRVLRLRARNQPPRRRGAFA